MKQIIVKTQEELDKITRIEKDEEVIIESQIESQLVLNCCISVFGKLRIHAQVACSWGGKYFVARENASVVAWGNASVVAWENASVEARGNASVEAWENASVVARENASVEAWENASVVARGNASVVARGNASVEARENASVEAWENAITRLFSTAAKVILYGFSVLFCEAKTKFNITVKSKHAHIQIFKPLDWFENNAIEKKKKIILFKKVSKDFKTQEGMSYETNWPIGGIVEHPKWEPKSNE